MRSKWKGNFFDPSVFFERTSSSNKTTSRFIFSARSKIPSYLVGERVFVHDGKAEKSFLVKDFVTNSGPRQFRPYFGEFLTTKIQGRTIHLAKRKGRRK